jgi:transposase
MKAYSADVCAKIAQACDEGTASRRQLARQFHVSVAFIQKMLRRRRLTGRFTAAHTGGRHSLLDAAALAFVARLIREQNDLTLAELCERVAAERDVRVSVPTMYRAVRRLRLPYKKSSYTPLSVTRHVCRLSASSIVLGVLHLPRTLRLPDVWLIAAMMTMPAFVLIQPEATNARPA